MVLRLNILRFKYFLNILYTYIYKHIYIYIYIDIYYIYRYIEKSYKENNYNKIKKMEKGII